jgi:uncharacterized protein with PIN domain
VVVRGVLVTWPVRPCVAVAGLGPQPAHELFGGCHGLDSKIALMRPRFLADCNVGRLARWLRALGYDASYHPRIGDAELVREAAAESRVLLTRDRDLTKRRVIQTGVVHAILIRDDEVTAQLRQVFAELGLELKEALTRCIECNSELQLRVAAAVAERVPPYVRRTQSRYSECPSCGRIYWAGTHWQRMREVLAGL